jgi:exonuclease SbcC
MITQVRLRNWKSHKDTELQFGDGTNVLVGIMGSGKTGVMDAIAYALFGTLPAVRGRVIKLEQMIMDRPRQMDSAEVEVQFIAPDGNEYIVKRVIERGSGTTLSELRRASGELIESPSSTRVTETIEGMLKMDAELFERAVYSEQNRLDYFLVLGRGRRMESIDELLGIDKLERARKNMGTLINNLRERIDEKMDEKSRLERDTTLATLPTLEQDLKDLELERQEIQVRLQQLQPRLDEVRTQMNEMRAVELKVTQLEKSLRELSGTINELKRRIEQTREKLGDAASVEPAEIKKQVVELQDRYTKARSVADELSRMYTQRSSRVGEIKTRMEMVRSRIAEVEKDIERKRAARFELEKVKLEDVVELVKKLQLEVKEMSDELAACHARLQDIEQSSEELAEAGSTCPVCESPLSDEKKQQLLQQRNEQRMMYAKRAADLENNLKKLNLELEEKLKTQRFLELLAKETEDLPSLEDKVSQLKQNIQTNESELTDAQADLERVNSDFERARKEIDSANEQLTATKQTLEMRLDLERSEKELKQKQAESLRVQQELWKARRGYDEVKAKTLANEFVELSRAQERLKTEFTAKEQLMGVKQQLVKSVREKKEALARSGVEIGHLQQAVQSLQVIQNALAQTQTTMRKDFVEAVNVAMNEFWREIYPYGDFTGIRLAVEDDYVLQLRSRTGSWVAVEGLTSGGERTCACLALRIAFAIVLAPALNWLVLDEPTHNLDSEGIQELAIALRERIPEIVRQVLLITHEERLEAAVSGYLYRFVRNKELDEPTRVEQVTAPEALKRIQ